MTRHDQFLFLSPIQVFSYDSASERIKDKEKK